MRLAEKLDWKGLRVRQCLAFYLQSRDEINYFAASVKVFFIHQLMHK
jgi:hypothetical protein